MMNKLNDLIPSALGIAAAFFLVMTASPASAGEFVEFDSATKSPSKLRVRLAKQQGIELAQEPGTRIAGYLYKPDGVGPFPALVLIHGCRGVRSFQRDWARQLTDWGYVALLVDSFGPRNTKEVCTVPYQESFGEVAAGRVFDAYGGLEYLASLPFVDPERIAAMGWSGLRFLGTVAQAGVHAFFERKFKAAVSLYPDCGDAASGEFYTPLMIAIGANDDWTPARTCKTLARTAVAVGSTVELTVYPDTYHSFDDPEVGEHFYATRVYNIHKNPARGATLAYSRVSHQDVVRRVRAFLIKHLNPQLSRR